MKSFLATRGNLFREVHFPSLRCSTDSAQMKSKVECLYAVRGRFVQAQPDTPARRWRSAETANRAYNRETNFFSLPRKFCFLPKGKRTPWPLFEKGSCPNLLLLSRAPAIFQLFRAGDFLRRSNHKPFGYFVTGSRPSSGTSWPEVRRNNGDIEKRTSRSAASGLVRLI